MSRKHKRAPIVAVSVPGYVAGHFLEPVRRWFGPHWQPTIRSEGFQKRPPEGRRGGWGDGYVGSLGPNSKPFDPPRKE